MTTAIVGRDQEDLAQPWVKKRSMEVDGLGVNPFDFTISKDDVERLYRSGQAAARAFLKRYERSRSAMIPPMPPK